MWDCPEVYQARYDAKLEEIRKAWRLRQDESKTIYYENIITFKSQWEEPEDWDPDEAARADLPETMCQLCMKRDATRFCGPCKMRYCIGCFADAHTVGEKRTHEPTIIVKTAEVKELRCAVCDELATYRCTKTKYAVCEEHYDTVPQEDRRRDVR